MATLKLKVLTDVKTRVIAGSTVLSFTAVNPDSNIMSVWCDEALKDSLTMVEVNGFIALTGHSIRSAQYESRLLARMNQTTKVSMGALFYSPVDFSDAVDLNILMQV